MTLYERPPEPSYHRSSYAIIPSYILDDDTLDEGAKTLYARISMYSKEGRCWAANKHFAEKQKVDVRTISRWLSQLKKAGYIIIEIDTSDWQTRRDIWITGDFKKFNTAGHTCPPPPAPMSYPPRTNVHPSYKININQQQQIENADAAADEKSEPPKPKIKKLNPKDLESIEALRKGLIDKKVCTPQEFDQFDSKFLSKAIKLYGLRAVLTEIHDFFAKRSVHQRASILNPPGLILMNLQENYDPLNT